MKLSLKFYFGQFDTHFGMTLNHMCKSDTAQFSLQGSVFITHEAVLQWVALLKGLDGGETFTSSVNIHLSCRSFLFLLYVFLLWLRSLCVSQDIVCCFPASSTPRGREWCDMGIPLCLLEWQLTIPTLLFCTYVCMCACARVPACAPITLWQMASSSPQLSLRPWGLSLGADIISVCSSFLGAVRRSVRLHFLSRSLFLCTNNILDLHHVLLFVSVYEF